MALSRLVRLCFAALLAAGAAVPAQVTLSAWTPEFKGVDFAKGALDGPHPSVFYAARIDLREKGIRFFATPHEGPLDTMSRTTSAFLLENHLQLAINTGFFDPCCKAVREAKDVSGLAISQGKLVSLPATGMAYDVALMIDRHRHARIAHVSPLDDLHDIETAIAGSAVIVAEGKNNGVVNGLHSATEPNPRTVVGISQDGRFLYFVVVDGRKKDYSIGTTNTESADIMIKVGAFTALNVDGGGSTVMVKDDGHSGAVEINRPSGSPAGPAAGAHPSAAGQERWDAIQLGLYAKPLK